MSARPAPARPPAQPRRLRQSGRAALRAARRAIGRDLDDCWSPRSGRAASLLHGRDRKVRRQRQVGRFQREALVVGQGLQRLHGPPRAAEYVRRVGHLHLAGKQVEDGREPELAGVVDGPPIADCCRVTEAAVDGRIERTLAGRDVRLRHAQSRLGRGEIGIIPERLFDQAFEWAWEAEDPPPVAGDVAAFGETLCLPIGDIRRCRLRRQSSRGVAVGLGRRRRAEVRTEGATGEQRGGEHRSRKRVRLP